MVNGYSKKSKEEHIVLPNVPHGLKYAIIKTMNYTI